jgi:hypothetical protein
VDGLGVFGAEVFVSFISSIWLAVVLSEQLEPLWDGLQSGLRLLGRGLNRLGFWVGRLIGWSMFEVWQWLRWLAGGGVSDHPESGSVSSYLTELSIRMDNKMIEHYAEEIRRDARSNHMPLFEEEEFENKDDQAK